MVILVSVEYAGKGSSRVNDKMVKRKICMNYGIQVDLILLLELNHAICIPGLSAEKDPGERKSEQKGWIFVMGMGIVLSLMSKVEITFFYPSHLLFCCHC